MKKAKFIKNEFYKTLYRANDDTFKYALIFFTTVRYEDKESEEFVTFNRIEEAECNNTWEDKLSKKISNFEEFMNEREVWKEKGIYVEKEGEKNVRYFEPESVDKQVFENVQQIEITQVLDKDINLAFVEIYDQTGDKYSMTCSFDQKDIILSKLIANYGKLCKKGRVSILNKEEENLEETDHIVRVVFIVNKNMVETYVVSADEYDREHLYNITLEEGLNKVDSDGNIDVEYKAVIDGQYSIITREKFDAFLSVINDSNKENSNSFEEEEEEGLGYIVPSHRTNYANYVLDDSKTKKRIAIGAAAVTVLGIAACYIFRNKDNVQYKGKLNKSTTTSFKNNNSNPTVTTPATQDEYIVTSVEDYINNNGTTTSNTSINSDTVSDTNTTTISLPGDSSMTNYVNGDGGNIVTSTNTNNNVTTNNDYVTTTKPANVYTGTYRTVRPADTAVSGNTTKTTTKSTTQNVVPSGTIDRRDMVTAGPKPGDQAFTKDGATTTTKSTTSYNKYADLIITGDINAAKPDTNKSLVLKK